MLGSTGRSPGLFALAAMLCLALAPQDSRANEQVDLELVLAVDVSGSMDRDEQILQRAGYVNAIRHPEVVDAIRTGLTGRIAMTYVEWAGPAAQRVVVPWRLVDGQASADEFAAQVDAAPLGTMRGTSISSSLLLAAGLFANSAFEGYRQVIDVSGDGPNNMGPPVIPVRDEVVAMGIVINGLPIMLKQGGYGFGSINNLDDYYANCVIGGPGAFLLAVDHPSGLIDAIRRKMILEIADISGGFESIVARPVVDHDYDCMIGERQRRGWMDR
ncbi:MAG TPA: DUF1194 domain-containing protein [Methylomirabilota bacterium]|nr:DUF1194 domain-containing protein [Methylomirabilota bacterium]